MSVKLEPFHEINTYEVNCFLSLSRPWDLGLREFIFILCRDAHISSYTVKKIHWTSLKQQRNVKGKKIIVSISPQFVRFEGNITDGFRTTWPFLFSTSIYMYVLYILLSHSHRQGLPLTHSLNNLVQGCDCPLPKFA